MADPFSILAGAAGLADVCVRFANFLKSVKDDFQNTQAQLDALENQVTTLKTLANQVKDICERSRSNVVSVDQAAAASQWNATGGTLQQCQRVINELEALLRSIVNPGSTRKKVDLVEKVRRHGRLVSKDGEFRKLQKQLQQCCDYLHIHISTGILLYTTDIAAQVPILRDVQSEIAALRTATDTALAGTRHAAIDSAQAVLRVSSPNEHYDPPRAVSSIYTGREEQLAALKQWVFEVAPGEHIKQKRFVVYGPPGSGKTEFCCKFASENKHRFWAVFHVVASSRQHVAEDFAQIARYGKRDANERAGKSWLSSVGRDRPWLLIIDNADTDSFPIEECYPDGDNGTILLTTRDVTMRTQGTIGDRYFEFRGLGEEHSCQLLLTAADQWDDCSENTRRAAMEICERLGHLPLALTHAGRTILERAMRLEDYLGFFESNWAQVRRSLRQRSQSDMNNFDASAVIFASFELIHDSLQAKADRHRAASDALDLLKISSYFHHQRIRIDLLYLAAVNPTLEQQFRQNEARESAKWSQMYPRPRLPLHHKLRNSLVRIISEFIELSDRPALPRLLLEATLTGDTSDVHQRVTGALKELTRWSLVFQGAGDDTYSMNPAVHYWIRERPQMLVGERAVWCHIAATILSRAILAPPLHDTEGQEILRRDLQPHVASVQQREVETQRMLTANLESKRRQLWMRRFWPVVTSDLDRVRTVQLFKFSLVYMQGGLLERAKELQETVLAFVTMRLGPSDDRSMNLKRLLASTLWMMNQHEAAARLRKEVLDVSREVRGDEHPETLKVMDEYGSALWQQGRIAEALKYHSMAVEGFKKALGGSHRDTLRAMGNLGRVVVRDWKFDEAVNIQLMACTGLQQQLGASHPDTLEAMDNLAMAYFDRVAYGHGQPGDLDKAVALEEAVFERRKEKFGREHVLTLWAGLNLARIKGLLGHIDDALAIYNAGHVIALRNLGEHHFAVLFGKTHYSRILLYAKRYDEAERILMDVIDHSNTAHPDRLMALFTLIKCRRAMGKTEGMSVLHQELLAHARTIFRDDHPAMQYILDPRNQLLVNEIKEPMAPPTPIDTLKPDDSEQMILKYGHVAVGVLT